MSTLNQPIAAGFTPGERDYIRRELDMFFSTYPTVAEGFMVKTWRGGVDAGKPKLSPVAKGLIDRGRFQEISSSWRNKRHVQTVAISRTIPTHHTAISIASGEMVGCWLQPLKVVRGPDGKTGDAPPK